MNLRHHSLLPRSSSPFESSQNPDSSSGKLDSAENDDSNIDEGKIPESKSVKNEGINLSLHKCRKAAITLVRQKDEVSSSDKEDLKCNRLSDVWRPY